MPTLHDIAGVQAPPTTATHHVLAAMEALVEINASMEVLPSLLPLLEQELVLYRREPRGQDRYRKVTQILESSPAVRECVARLGMEWPEIIRSRWEWVVAALKEEPAREDCDGLACWTIACAREKTRAWCNALEFRQWGELHGWHAQAIIEVAADAEVLGEVPMSTHRSYALHFPYRLEPLPGKRLAAVDACYLGKMPRPDMPQRVWSWPKPAELRRVV